ncbi:peptide deformylase [Rhodobacter sp. KR11]|uniref:peptide deformylase n=1 Tax=Rhodobacter sp. KR11 TaxID=2974588 RepID=UPI0029CAADAC|nr:peptide deformylase [Rhodobacter sp. KR11]
MILPLRLWPDPVLSQVCGAVPVDAAALSLAEDMLQTMYAAYGRGLAAPQVGVLARVFVMDSSWKTGEKTPEIFLNPEVLWSSPETQPSTEGCLSIPGQDVTVTRSQAIILRWTMPDGAIAAQKLTGFRAICAQHEIDHLNGIVTLNRAPT